MGWMGLTTPIQHQICWSPNILDHSRYNWLRRDHTGMGWTFISRQLTSVPVRTHFFPPIFGCSMAYGVPWPGTTSEPHLWPTLKMQQHQIIINTLCWVGLGIEPVSQGSRDATIPVIPQQELPYKNTLKMEAESGVMQLQAKEYQGLMATSRGWKWQRRILPRVRGSIALLIPWF